MIKDSDNMIGKALENILSGILVVTDKGVVISSNQSAKNILNLQSGNSRELDTIKNLFNSETEEALSHAISTACHLPQIRLKTRDKGKESMTLCGSFSPVYIEKSRFTGGVIWFRDVTPIARLANADRICEGCYQGIIGNSREMRQIVNQLPDISMADIPVLLIGKSGTGKELVARAIHQMSSRSRNPFIAVNCGAIPDSLVESELFGYKRGAFTDAKFDKKGLIEVANGGTLFLDEIGNASPAFQMKLLRVLQEGNFVPLGGVKPVDVSIRIIAATNANLLENIRTERFRADLYYRLAVIRFNIPDLKDRRQDIPLLIDSIVEKIRNRTSKSIRGLTLNAIKVLYDYNYPGNVRELENILERAFVLCQEEKIDIQHLPDNVVNLISCNRLRDDSSFNSENSRLHYPEKERIVEVLNQTKWSRQKAAEVLNMHRSTLYRKMKNYNLL